MVMFENRNNQIGNKDMITFILVQRRISIITLYIIWKFAEENVFSRKL